MNVIWSWSTIDHRKLQEHTEAENSNERKEIHGCSGCSLLKQIKKDSL